MLAYASLYTTLPPLYSVTCASGDTNVHVNLMLNINNGAVSIPAHYIQNDCMDQIHYLDYTHRGLTELGLQGYYTCRTEGDTYLSSHILHPSKYLYSI